MSLETGAGTREIVVTAEPFGYGPASSAKVVVEYLRRSDTAVSIRYVAAESALEFGKLNSEVYDEIVDAEQTPLTSYLDQTDPDLLISSMEPQATIEATLRGIETVTLDELFWFWQFGDAKTIVSEVKRRQSQPEQLRSYIGDLTGDNVDLAAHTLADRAFLQKYPGKDQITDLTRQMGNVTEVNPIIDTGHREETGERTRVIVSLCGQLNPAVTVDRAVEYARRLLSIYESTFRAFESAGYDVTVAGHPDVIAELSTPFTTGSFGHTEWLSMLNETLWLLCPPSIGSIFEGLMYGSPVCLIPEQHPGHRKEFGQMRAAAGQNPFPGTVLCEQFDRVAAVNEQGQDPDYDDVRDGVETILDTLEDVASWDESRLQREFTARPTTEELLDDRFRERVLATEREAILGGVGETHSGGKQIAEQTLSAHLSTD